MKKIINILTKIAENQQKSNGSTIIENDVSQFMPYINKMYTLLQQQFNQDELEAQWTVRKNNEQKQQKPFTSVFNCRPAAFGNTIDSVQEVTKMFSNKFISSHKWGALSNIVIEFIEGETGAFYFSKISQFKTLGV